ncbi:MULTISPECIES: protease inhibitor I42 family protein [unclassified Sphingomonas]|uniref:protease inhibitor I42 family protein n=1 Tax=unclassified Sphingomonas TaxID=196159 RepID=UPI00226A7A8B|nr:MULTISPECIES: protease inhibitor I42 family protein [unclassified Sphingomonas]
MRLLSATLLSLAGGVASALLLPAATAQHGIRAPLTEADSGGSFSVPRGTVVTVTLNRAAGTGYLWRYVARIGILPVNARTAPGGAEQPGGAEAQIFQFRTVTPQSEAAFALARPWEGDRPAAKTVRYAFTADPPR